MVDDAHDNDEPDHADDPDRADADPADEAGLRVDDGMWVTVRYRLFDSLQEPVEDSPRELRYLHGGFGAVFPKLESSLAGRPVGAQFSVTLQPDDAFGDYDAALLTLVAADRLPEGSEIGMSFDGIPGQAADGHIYTLTDIAQGQAVLDGNHPLAGMALRYDITVEAIEPATAEEIAQEQRESMD